MSEPQQIINIGAVANDGTGESLRDAFNAVNNNFANIWAAGPVNTQVVITNNRISTNETNLDLILAGNGTANVTVASTVVPSIDSVYDLGSPSRYFDTTYSRYFYGNGRYLTGISGGSGSGGNVTFSVGPPSSPSIGDIWIEADTGVQYLYFNDNTSNQWAEMEAYISFSAGTSNGGSGNVDLTAVTSDIIPTPGNVYSLGNTAQPWQNMWLANTLWLGNNAVVMNGNTLTVNGSQVLTGNSNPRYNSISVVGNVVTNAIYTNNYFYANGAPFPQGNGIAGSTIAIYGNVIETTVTNQNLTLNPNGIGVIQANASYVPSVDSVYDIGTSNNQINSVYAQYFYGNGRGITGIVAEPVNTGNWAFLGNTLYNINGGSIENSDLTHGSTALISLPANGNTRPLSILNYYGNFSVTTANAPSYTKSWTFDYTGNITLPTNTANINYANGISILNGVSGSYGNANVAAYLPTYTGNLNPGTISATGNVTSNNLIATGNIYIGNTVFTRTLTVGRAVTPVTVPLASNNSFNVLTVGSGNVVVYTT
jgi:hypothetical protein